METTGYEENPVIRARYTGKTDPAAERVKYGVRDSPRTDSPRCITISNERDPPRLNADKPGRSPVTNTRGSGKKTGTAGERSVSHYLGRKLKSPDKRVKSEGFNRWLNLPLANSPFDWEMYTDAKLKDFEGTRWMMVLVKTVGMYSMGIGN